MRALLAVVLALPLGAAGLGRSGLDRGYRQLYNLQFAAAHQTFAAWTAEHPDDPLGPASDAVVYLFAEMQRLQILQAQFFSDNRDFLNGPEGVTDPAFGRDLAASEAMAARALQAHPDDAAALYAEALCHGLRSDDEAILHHRYLASLAEMKAGREAAERLLARDPNFGDAYLAVGIENYVLGQRAAPVRWLLRLDGAQTDRTAGLRELAMTAANGHYLAPYAKILLAIAALRSHEGATAAGLLAGLAEEFPGNPLYAQELARLEPGAKLDPARSRVGFTLGAFLHTVHGTFAVTSGEMHWDAATGAAAGAIVVAAASGESGNPDRDRDMRDKVLEADRYPEIIFTPDRVEGSVARQGKSQVTLHGTLRLQGADHPWAVPLSVNVDGTEFTASGRATVPYVAWGLRDPSNLVLRVAKTVELKLEMAGTLAWPEPAR